MSFPCPSPSGRSHSRSRSNPFDREIVSPDAGNNNNNNNNAVPVHGVAGSLRRTTSLHSSTLSGVSGVTSDADVDAVLARLTQDLPRRHILAQTLPSSSASSSSSSSSSSSKWATLWKRSAAKSVISDRKENGEGDSACPLGEA